MPEFIVTVAFEGVGKIKVRAESLAQASEDAALMAAEDIDWDSYDIKVVHAEGGALTK